VVYSLFTKHNYLIKPHANIPIILSELVEMLDREGQNKRNVFSNVNSPLSELWPTLYSYIDYLCIVGGGGGFC